MSGNLVATGGTVSFPNAVVVASSTTPTLDTHLATKKYVDDTAVSGAPDATESGKGNVELATRAEMALGTATGGTGANLVLKSEYATSTPSATTSVVISDTDGKLKQEWLDLTEDFDFTGDTTLASTTFTGTTTFNNAAIFNSPAYGAGFFNREIFTSSGTWTKPAGVTTAYIEVQGAGGGGSYNNNSSGGAGAGGYCNEIIDVSAETSVTVTVGSGGSGGTTAKDGGLSSFGSFCTGNGGSGGASGEVTGSAGGTATGGDINITGQSGEHGVAATLDRGGFGGDSMFGFGGQGGENGGSETGGSGIGYGSGS
jgi:hypothetical protein